MGHPYEELKSIKPGLETTQGYHHIELNALCMFTLAEADCSIQSRFRILLQWVKSRTVIMNLSLCHINCGWWAPSRFATWRRENGKDVPQSMLEESVKGIVNHRPKVTSSQCSESGIKLSAIRIFLSHMAIIWLLIRPGPLFCFYGSLFIPAEWPAFHTHTITSPEPVVSNPFVSNGET